MQFSSYNTDQIVLQG